MHEQSQVRARAWGGEQVVWAYSVEWSEKSSLATMSKAYSLEWSEKSTLRKQVYYAYPNLFAWGQRAALIRVW